jgi:hypothetical protein
MNWHGIGEVRLPEQATEKMREKHKQLTALREEILQKRIAADELTANIAGPQYDHTKIFQVQISAIEDEISLEEQLIVYELACSQFTLDRKSAAKARLHEAELLARNMLAIPDAIPVPIAVLQNCKNWWVARSAHDGISVWPIDTRPHEENLLVLQDVLEHLRKRLGGEQRRLQHAADVEAAKGEFEARVIAQQEARRAPYDRRAQAVADLLAEDEPEPEQSRPKRGAKA